MIALYQYINIAVYHYWHSKMIYKSSYQAIPNGRWFVFYFTHHTFLQTETTLLLYFYVAKVTRAINKAQITQAILNKICPGTPPQIKDLGILKKFEQNYLA